MAWAGTSCLKRARDQQCNLVQKGNEEKWIGYAVCGDDSSRDEGVPRGQVCMLYLKIEFNWHLLYWRSVSGFRVLPCGRQIVADDRSPKRKT
jgi:hypothetical protein